MAGGEGEPVILCVLPSRCAFEWRQVVGDQKPERHALSNGGSGKRRDSRLLKGQYELLKCGKVRDRSGIDRLSEYLHGRRRSSQEQCW